MKRRWAGRVAAALGIAATAGVAPASAGNLDGTFLSDEAAMLGGAVTATAADPGAAWYNPAGLGRNTRSEVSLSGSAFALRLRGVPDGMATSFPDQVQTRDLESAELVSVPAALGIVRGVGERASLAFAVFAPEVDRMSLVGLLRRDLDEPNVDFGQEAQSTRARTRYHLGPAAGFAVGPRLRVGGAVFAVYEKEEQRARYWVDIVPGDGSGFHALWIGESNLHVERLGAEASLGVQWEPAAGLHVGLTARSPRWKLTEVRRGDGISTRSIVAPDKKPLVEFTFDDERGEAEGGIGVVAPPRFDLGVAWVFDGGVLAADVGASPLLDLAEPARDVEAVVNARAGARFSLAGRTELGLGAFTDRSAAPPPERFPDQRVHYYGVSAGLHTETPVSLAAAEGVPSLVFSTTLGLRYAVGLGQAAQARFSLTQKTAGDLALAAAVPVDVLFHEIGLHVGSELRF